MWTEDPREDIEETFGRLPVFDVWRTNDGDPPFWEAYRVGNIDTRGSERAEAEAARQRARRAAAGATPLAQTRLRNELVLEAVAAGKSYAEVAVQFNISQASVRQTVCRGRKKAA